MVTPVFLNRNILNKVSEPVDLAHVTPSEEELLIEILCRRIHLSAPFFDSSTLTTLLYVDRKPFLSLKEKKIRGKTQA